MSDIIEQPPATLMPQCRRLKSLKSGNGSMSFNRIDTEDTDVRRCGVLFQHLSFCRAKDHLSRNLRALACAS